MGRTKTARERQLEEYLDNFFKSSQGADPKAGTRERAVMKIYNRGIAFKLRGLEALGENLLERALKISTGEQDPTSDEMSV